MPYMMAPVVAIPSTPALTGFNAALKHSMLKIQDHRTSVSDTPSNSGFLSRRGLTTCHVKTYVTVQSSVFDRNLQEPAHTDDHSTAQPHAIFASRESTRSCDKIRFTRPHMIRENS